MTHCPHFDIATEMNMTTKILLSLLTCAALAGALAGCNKDAPASLFDPNYVSGPTPTVTRIDPPSDALSGVTMLTITGTNFSTAPANNLIFFDAVAVPVIQASATQLQVKAPILVSDSIKVKIAVLGSDFFNTPFVYKLGSATEAKFGNLSAAEEVTSLECDTAGNVYASMLSSGAGFGVWKFSSAGVRGAAVYSPPFSTSVGSWRGMKFGPGGTLYSVAGRNIIFQIPPGGGTPTAWVIGGGLTSLNDLDFDANGNIWAGGPTATSVFRVKPDKSVQAFPFTGTVRSVRVYAGYLYVGGKRDSLEKVWRFPITGDNLGTEEEYFNISSIYGANSSGVYGIAFNTDGDMYVGTDGAAGIVIVHQNRSSEPYYSGLLLPATLYLTWGKGADLFQGRGGTVNPKTIVRINTQKTSAPYYGRTLP